MQEIRKVISKQKKKFRLRLHLISAFIRAYILCIKWLARYVASRFSGKKIIIIALYEHIGDVISCEPIVGYARQQHKQTEVAWAIKRDYAELLECHPGINNIIKLRYFYEWILLKKYLSWLGFPEKNIIDLHINGKPCSVFKRKLHKKNTQINFNNHLHGMSQLEAFSISAGLPPVNSQPVFYVNPVKAIDLQVTPYIVFHTQSNMKMKDWNVEDWNCLCLFCLKAGFYVVEVGINRMVEINHEKYINYTGKKSLQSIASIINKSAFFIGVDSGFAHMANALQKKGLVLIGQYKIDKTVFNRYNPFTGMYAGDDYILYANNDVVATIPCARVTETLSQKLNLAEYHAQ